MATSVASANVAAPCRQYCGPTSRRHGLSGAWNNFTAAANTPPDEGDGEPSFDEDSPTAIDDSCNSQNAFANAQFVGFTPESQQEQREQFAAEFNRLQENLDDVEADLQELYKRRAELRRAVEAKTEPLPL